MSLVTYRELLIGKLLQNNETTDDVLAVWLLHGVDLDEKFDMYGYNREEGVSVIVWTEKNRYEFTEYDGQNRLYVASRQVPAMTSSGMHRYIDL